jgi:hypothetical protein
LVEHLQRLFAADRFFHFEARARQHENVQLAALVVVFHN